MHTLQFAINYETKIRVVVVSTGFGCCAHLRAQVSLSLSLYQPPERPGERRERERENIDGRMVWMMLGVLQGDEIAGIPKSYKKNMRKRERDSERVRERN